MIYFVSKDRAIKLRPASGYTLEVCENSVISWSEYLKLGTMD